jgi:fructose-1,6-bisphosphatase II
MTTTPPDRNLALELVRVTEAAALAAGRYMGRGVLDEGDRAAMRAMRLMLDSIDMDGSVVIGEGEKSQVDALYTSQRLGTRSGPEMDVCVNAVDGSRLLALGRPNALSVAALAERGSLFDPGPAKYMDKIAVGPASAGAIDVTVSVEENIWAIARARRKDLDDLTIVVLDRLRHEKLIEDIRATGARIVLITDGDVAGAVMAAAPGTGIDALMGVGGSREGVAAACALKCYGGTVHARLAPQSEEEREAVVSAGMDPEMVLGTNDLVASDDVFFAATGITDGELVKGVRYSGTGARTHSIVMRSRSGTVRAVEASHRWDKLMEISQVDYDSSTPMVRLN